MEDIELKNIWKSYERRLEEAQLLNLQSWALNMQCFEMLQRQKMKSKLGRLALVKTLMIAAGIVWVVMLGFLVLHSLQWHKIFFTLSVGAILLFNLYAIAAYIGHLVLIQQINNSEQIVDTQLKLARLQRSTLQIVRILFLQTPFYCTWFIRPADIIPGNWQFYCITLPIILVFVVLTAWLYRNISYRNIEKKWFRAMFRGAEWTYVAQSIDFVKEIEAFKANV